MKKNTKNYLQSSLKWYQVLMHNVHTTSNTIPETTTT